jgi:putative transposase
MPTTYVQLYIHLVWATWDRLPILIGSVRDTAYACIATDCKELGVKVIAIGGTDDHVHLLASIPTTVCIADLMKQIKGSSSHLLNHRTSSEECFKWQGGYAAFTVSKSMKKIIMQYIANQERHHADGTTDKDAELAWEEQEASA